MRVLRGWRNDRREIPQAKGTFGMTGILGDCSKDHELNRGLDCDAGID
jgi:hypothetical protein